MRHNPGDYLTDFGRDLLCKVRKQLFETICLVCAGGRGEGGITLGAVIGRDIRPVDTLRC